MSNSNQNQFGEDIDSVRLKNLQSQAGGAVEHSHVPDELVEQYKEANEILRELGDGNLRDWVTQQYREWYQDWLAGERDAPCKCSNPGCPLKNGKLFYEIRRSDSPFSIRTGTPMEDRIKAALDDHPEAVVLSESLTELQDKKHTVRDMYEDILRREARTDPEERDANA